MYKWLNNKESVLRISDNANIPCVDGNADYEEFKEWLKNNSEPEPEFSVEYVRDEVYKKIKGIAKERKRWGVSLFGGIFQSSTNAKSTYLHKIQLIESGAFNKILWVTIDNKSIDLDVDKLKKLHFEVELYHQAIFEHASKLIEKVKKSKKPQSIKITEGWPE